MSCLLLTSLFLVSAVPFPPGTRKDWECGGELLPCWSLCCMSLWSWCQLSGWASCSRLGGCRLLVLWVFDTACDAALQKLQGRLGILLAIYQELYHASPAILHVAIVVFRGHCPARSSTVETRVLPRWSRSEWAVDQAVGGAQSHNSQHQASQSLQRPLALWFGAYVR